MDAQIHLTLITVRALTIISVTENAFLNYFYNDFVFKIVGIPLQFPVVQDDLCAN